MGRHKILIAVAAQYSRSRAFESFLKEEGYDVRVVTRNMTNKFSFLNYLREIVSWKPQIVHVINDPEFLVLPIIFASKLIGAKIIYDKRANCSLERKELRGDMFYYVERFAEVFGGPFYDKKITPLYQVHKEKNYVLIPQTMIFKKSIKTQKKSIKKIVLTAGYFSKIYGLEVLVAAIKYIKRKDIELRVYGAGPGLEQFDAAGKKDARMKFFKHIPHGCFVKEIENASVCVIPFNKMGSSEYASPYSVLKLGEFSFLKKPIVCADVGDMRIAEKNGVVFYKPGDSKDLAEKISMLLKKPKKTTFFKELARNKVKNEYLEVVHSLL